MYDIGQAEIEAVADVIRSGQLFRYRGGEGGQADAISGKLDELRPVGGFRVAAVQQPWEMA